MSPPKLSPEASGCGDSSAASKVVPNNGSRKRMNKRYAVPSARKFNARAPSEHGTKELIQAALQELEQKEIIQKVGNERKRSISMSDMTPPKSHRRLEFAVTL